jgi:hypothetical protein
MPITPNPFAADPVLTITKEALAQLPHAALVKITAALLDETSQLLAGLAGEHGLNITKHPETGQLRYHIHRPDEAGECHNAVWTIEGAALHQVLLAGIRELLTGETPTEGELIISPARPQKASAA